MEPPKFLFVFGIFSNSGIFFGVCWNAKIILLKIFKMLSIRSLVMNIGDLLTSDFTVIEFLSSLFLGVLLNFKNSWPEDPQLF